MIKIAKERDKGEKAFRRIKSAFKLDTPGTHNVFTYKGKMFVAFVALIIVEAYRWFIKDVLNETTSTTTGTTIDILNNYEIHRKKDNAWMPSYAMTKKQKEIFQCLGLSEEEAISNLKSFCLQLETRERAAAEKYVEDAAAQERIRRAGLPERLAKRLETGN